MSRIVIWTFLTACLVLSASLLTWCYFQVDVPRKVPVRAKQVLKMDTSITTSFRFNG